LGRKLAAVVLVLLLLVAAAQVPIGKQFSDAMARFAEQLQQRLSSITQSVTDTGSQVVKWVWDTIITPIGKAISGFITTIANAITKGFKTIIDSVIGVVKAIIEVPMSAISKLAEGIRRVISTLFGLGLLAYGVHKMSKGDTRFVSKASVVVGALFLVLPVAIPPIGYAIAGAVIMGIGMVIAGFSARFPPPISTLIGGIGAIIVVVGAMIGLYGIMPQHSLIIFGIGFTLVFIVAIYVFIKTVLARK